MDHVERLLRIGFRLRVDWSGDRHRYEAELASPNVTYLASGATPAEAIDLLRFARPVEAEKFAGRKREAARQFSSQEKSRRSKVKT